MTEYGPKLAVQQFLSNYHIYHLVSDGFAPDLQSNDHITGAYENAGREVIFSQFSEWGSDTARMSIVATNGSPTSVRHARDPWHAHPSSFHTFDNKCGGRSKSGPLIPTQRRRAIMEISEIQELTLLTCFENREYGRPYAHFMATLPGFD